MAERSLLEISREMAALAQTGLAYTRDAFDRERFERLRELAGEVLRELPHLADFEWPAELGYATPKVDVRAVVFRDERVLLIQEASSGLWTLPGGWADVNLTPAENAEKECWEESGFRVKARVVTALLDRDRAGYPRNPHSIYKIFFLCDILGGEARTSAESLQVDFFPLNDLPKLDPHRASAADIVLAWRHFQEGPLPAAFN